MINKVLITELQKFSEDAIVVAIGCHACDSEHKLFSAYQYPDKTFIIYLNVEDERFYDRDI